MEDKNSKKKVSMVIAELVGLDNIAHPEPFWHLNHLGAEYRQKYSEIAVGSIPGVSVARDLFKTIGIDPTKRRPSSEALLRRGLRDKQYYPINTLVDIGNWCSLEFLLPLCVYDSESIKGTISGRIGKKDDGYLAIDGVYLDLENRFLIYDKVGPCGSPIKDSIRTKVTIFTKKAILLIYAPGSYDINLLEEQMQIFVERVMKFCGGELIDCYTKEILIRE